MLLTRSALAGTDTAAVPIAIVLPSGLNVFLSPYTDPVAAGQATHTLVESPRIQEIHSTSPHLSSSSNPHSRTASPLRRLADHILPSHASINPNPPSRLFVLADPFARIKPFLSSVASFGSFIRWNRSDLEQGGQQADSCCRGPEFELPRDENLRVVLTFLYLHFLFRLPTTYFARVECLIYNAKLSEAEVEQMISAMSSRQPGNPPGNSNAQGITSRTEHHFAPAIPYPEDTRSARRASNVLQFPENWTNDSVSPALLRFKCSWEEFIVSLLREWKTLNIVSALLLSALVGLFQIDDANRDPLVRTSAFLSLACSLWSLSYGCIFIIRFSTMGSMRRASCWAREAERESTCTWWNIYVLLAMPAVWMAWSLVAFVVCIISYLWRTGAADDRDKEHILSLRAAVASRIAVTLVFSLGLVYLFYIIRTLARYGPKTSHSHHQTTPKRSTTPLPRHEMHAFDSQGRTEWRQPTFEPEIEDMSGVARH